MMKSLGPIERLKAKSRNKGPMKVNVKSPTWTSVGKPFTPKQPTAVIRKAVFFSLILNTLFYKIPEM